LLSSSITGTFRNGAKFGRWNGDAWKIHHSM